MTTKDYYANKNGFQLKDFLVEVHKSEMRNNNYYYTTPQGFYVLNALKYTVRAGKKVGNDFEDDTKKAHDYIAMGEDVGFPRYEMELYLDVLTETFYNWQGEKIDI